MDLALQQHSKKKFPHLEGSCAHIRTCGMHTTPYLSLIGDDSQGPILSPYHPGPSLSIGPVNHQTSKWHLRLCHYRQGVEQAAQEERSPHFLGRAPERWRAGQERRWSAASLLPRSPSHLLFLSFLPGSRQEAPKFPFFCLIPMFIVLQVQGCTVQDVLQPIQVLLASSLCFPTPLWMH